MVSVLGLYHTDVEMNTFTGESAATRLRAAVTSPGPQQGRYHQQGASGLCSPEPACYPPTPSTPGEGSPVP